LLLGTGNGSRNKVELMGPEPFPLPEPAVKIADRFANWLASIDQTNFFLALIFIVLIWLARNVIARGILELSSRLMKQLSVELPEQVRNELNATTAILIVVLALFPALGVLNLPAPAYEFLNRLLASVAIIAVFSGWYNLSGPFVSLLSNDRFRKIQMEAGWMERVAQFGVLLFAITSLLNVWQIDITGALTGVGVMGAGIAIATQDLIRNLIAGMNNMSEKRFAVGDVIQIEGVLVGTVENIDLRSTLIKGFDQIPRYVPNSDLSNAVVLNFTHRTNRRVLVSIPLVLSSSLAQITQVRDALRQYLSESGDFELTDDAPQHVYVEGLSDSAVPIIFYAWTRNPDYANSLQVNERLSLKILEIIEFAGTSLAYPTQTVELAKISAPDLINSSGS